MSRKVEYFEATMGRDKGRVYKITEMSATDGEQWAIECFLAMGSSGIDIPDGVASMGMVGLVEMGLKLLLKIPMEKARPLLDRMMECVEFVPTPSNKQLVRDLIDGYIEEIPTRFLLRKHILELHTSFFDAGEQQTSELAASPESGSKNTKTRPFSAPRQSRRE